MIKDTALIGALTMTNRTMKFLDPVECQPLSAHVLNAWKQYIYIYTSYETNINRIFRRSWGAVGGSSNAEQTT